MEREWREVLGLESADAPLNTHIHTPSHTPSRTHTLASQSPTTSTRRGKEKEKEKEMEEGKAIQTNNTGRVPLSTSTSTPLSARSKVYGGASPTRGQAIVKSIQGGAR